MCASVTRLTTISAKQSTTRDVETLAPFVRQGVTVGDNDLEVCFIVEQLQALVYFEAADHTGSYRATSE